LEFPESTTFVCKFQFRKFQDLVSVRPLSHRQLYVVGLAYDVLVGPRFASCFGQQAVGPQLNDTAFCERPSVAGACSERSKIKLIPRDVTLPFGTMYVCGAGHCVADSLHELILVPAGSSELMQLLALHVHVWELLA
jgi:hypothetical protein